jgi:drug/metabolite transporter (DMT)-like permease
MGVAAIIPAVLAPPSVDPVAALRANRRGIRFMIGAMACFVINDALVKVASASMPAAQLIFVRGVMAALLVFAVAHASGVALRRAELGHRWVGIRAAIDAVASVLYLVSLFHLPIANATAISMAAPLFIVARARPGRGVRVGPPPGAAIAVGFAGVLLVIRPGADGFNAFALLCLAATMLHALRDLSVRRIPAGIPSLAITFATATAVALLAGLLSLVEGWRAFGLRETALLAAAAVFLATGYLLIIRSTRAGDLSVVAPFRYTGLLWALLLGWAIWGHVPGALAWVGIALLIAAGLYLIRSDPRRG